MCNRFHLGELQMKITIGKRRTAQSLVGECLELVRQMVVPTFVLSSDGKVLVWNTACAELTGLDTYAVEGTANHWRGFYTQQRACLADIVLDAASLSNDGSSAAAYSAVNIDPVTGRAHAENWCDLPNGKRLYLAIDAGPIRNDKGQLVAVVETLRDLTAEKVFRDELAAKEAEREKDQAEQMAVVEGLADHLGSRSRAHELTSPTR